MAKTKAKGFNWARFEQDARKPPAGAITIDQFAERFEVAWRTARNRLTAAVKRGELATGKFRSQHGSPTNYYWEK